MADPTREQRIRTMVRIGIAPAEAERAVDRAEEFGYRDDLAELSTEVQEERARAWWWYQDAVRPSLRRLLDARPVDEGEEV